MNRNSSTFSATLRKLGLRRKKNHRHERRGRSLQLEPLEQRQLLAVDLSAAGFHGDGNDMIVRYDVQDNVEPFPELDIFHGDTTLDEQVSAFDIGIYRSEDGYQTDELLATRRISSPADLTPGRHEVAIAADFFDPKEDYTLIVRVDASGEVGEIDAMNNMLPFDGASSRRPTARSTSTVPTGPIRSRSANWAGNSA